MLSVNDRGRPLRQSLLVFSLLVCLLVGAVPASATRFLQFNTGRDEKSLLLRANGTVVMRLRPGLVTPATVERIAARLNTLALAGLKPSQITLKSTAESGKEVQIVAAGQTLITVGKELAGGGQASPAALAQSWAENLKKALFAPYIILEPRGRLQVPLGERRKLRWGGTAVVDISFAAGNPEILGLELDPAGGALLLQGVGIGNTTLTAALDGIKSVQEIEVKAWAARIAPDVVAEITSPPLPADDLRRTLRNAVLNAVRPAPNATVLLGEPERSGKEYAMRVRASGQDCFPIDKMVPVDLKPLPAPRPRPMELLISHLPERIVEPSTLLRERLYGVAPVRLLWHHVNNFSRPLRFCVRVINLGTQPARLHVTESAYGPHDDEIFVGHTAMARYMALTAQGEGYYLNVPAGRMCDLHDVRLERERIVSGLATVTPTSAGDLMVEVLAENSWPTDAYFPLVPEALTQDPPLTPYRFEAEKSVDLTHETGGAWTFYHIGKEYSVNLQGQKLFGDYGVLYTIRALFRNPTQKPARCELALRASGGVARATFLLNGQLMETGLLRGANEDIIYKSELPAGEQRTVTMVTIPESGSNYPITLTMRSWQ